MVMLALLLAFTQPPSSTAERIEVPLSQFRAGYRLFLCRSGATVALDYHDDHRVMRFWRVSDDTSFYLDDPIKAVQLDRSTGVDQWHVRAEGLAQNSRGMPTGTSVQIEMNIRPDSNNVGIADLRLQAADLRLQESGCRSIPAPQIHLTERQR